MSPRDQAEPTVYLDTCEPPRAASLPIGELPYKLGLRLREASIPFAEWLELQRTPTVIRIDAAEGLEQFWATCRSGQRLLWVADRAEVNRQSRVAAALECARMVLRFIPEDESLPRKALALVEAWVRDDQATPEIADMWFALWNRINYYDAEWHAEMRAEYETDPLPKIAGEVLSGDWSVKRPKSCPWLYAGNAVLDAVGAALSGYTSIVCGWVCQALWQEAVSDRGNWHVTPPSEDLVKALGKLDHAYLSNWRPPQECFPLDLTYRPPITDDLTGTPGFWRRIVGEHIPKTVERPQYAKHDLWGKPPTVFEEVDAKAEFDCAEIVGRHIPYEVIRSQLERLRVTP